MSKEQPLKHHTRMTIKMSIFLKWCEKAVAPRHNMTWTQFKEATNAKSTADDARCAEWFRLYMMLKRTENADRKTDTKRSC